MINWWIWHLISWDIYLSSINGWISADLGQLSMLLSLELDSLRTFDWRRYCLQVVVGARDALFRLSLDGLTKLEVAEWPATSTTVGLCTAKGQSEEHCRNFIKGYSDKLIDYLIIDWLIDWLRWNFFVPAFQMYFPLGICTTIFYRLRYTVLQVLIPTV